MAKPMTRERRAEMIERLIEDHVNTVREGDQTAGEWLRFIFRNGFAGYAAMSDGDIEVAYDDAGLAEQYDDAVEDEDA